MVGSPATACLVFVALVLVGCSASPIVEPKYCLPGADGNPDCVSAGPSMELSTSVRAACGTTDYSCLNKRALDLTNRIRGKYGKGGLQDGTLSMLKNALEHSKSLAYSFRHQDLTYVTDQIKCKIFCSAENIAYFTGPSDDPAKMCVDMWEKSYGHLQNILRNGDVTAIGIYKGPSGGTYCTQIFGLRGLGKGQSNGQSCTNA
jgi:uncharacterized protein YkwD